MDSEVVGSLSSAPRGWVSWLRGFGWVAFGTLTGWALFRVFGVVFLDNLYLGAHLKIQQLDSVMAVVPWLGALGGLAAGIVLALKGTRTRLTLALAGALGGGAAGLIISLLAGGIFTRISTPSDWDEFWPLYSLFFAGYWFQCIPVSGLAAGVGSAWIGKRKWGPLEWALTGFLAALLGLLLSVPMWFLPDVRLRMSGPVVVLFALVLEIIVSAGLTAGLAAWWVDRLAGGQASLAPRTARWFGVHISALVLTAGVSAFLIMLLMASVAF